MPSLLVVDDTPLIRSTIAQVVRRGAPAIVAVHEAANGVEAVELARRDRPEIVLMDIRMPGLDGLQAAAAIKAELPATRIVILSAYDEFPYVQRALKLGAVDYLLKPVRPAKLLELLAQLCADLRDEAGRDSLERPPAEAGEAPAPPQDPILQALDYIRQHHQSPEISLNAVAEAVNLSPSHLAHLLRERAGMSYKQQLTALRMDAARRLLRTTNLTVNAVGEAVGYQNATNFYRLFQRETGMTPAEYRRSAAESHA
ncbi:MAG TPA: response regulator [Chloroflexaceae bacterium]|nr:response regulator [Chloroflexaceae bacterium]